MAADDVVTVQDLEEEIICPVCHNEFDDPRFLPCHHYYCKRCILILANAEGEGKPFSCPECSASTVLPQGSPNGLPPAFVVNRVKERVKQALMAQQKDSPSTSHDHHPQYVCRKHQIALKMFCNDCNQLICPECALSHRTHGFEYVKEGGSNRREAIRGKGAELRALRETARGALAEIARRREEVVGQAKAVADDVTRAFDEMRRTLQRREEELHETIRNLTEQKVASLGAQEEEVRAGEAKLDEMVTLFEDTSKASDEHQFIMRKGLLALAQRELDVPRFYSPAEIPNLSAELNCAADIKSTCHSKTKVFLKKVYGVGISKAEVGKPASFTILPSDSDGPNPKITVSLVSALDSNNNTTNFSKVVKNPGGPQSKPSYEASYQPMVRGYHKLIVEIDGVPIEGSPFHVQVSISPTLLGKPVRVLKGFNKPYGIAFNSAQEMVVSESHFIYETNQVTVRDKSGTKLRDLKGHKPCHPQGVAVDDEDNIYVSENGGHCISKFSREGHFIQVVGRQGKQNTEFNAPRGLLVVKEEVFVCDSSNDRVQVYDRNLKFLRSICSPETKGVTDITADSSGQLHIVSNNASAIQVYDSVKQAPAQSIQHPSLSKPSGTCFDPMLNLLYVADSGSNCICIFRPDGSFIAKFGKEGSADGDFKFPYGIATDSDGFVYICDYLNNRIEVF
eukprot:Em0009g792a